VSIQDRGDILAKAYSLGYVFLWRHFYAFVLINLW
jgi:hypothetical protein